MLNSKRLINWLAALSLDAILLATTATAATAASPQSLSASGPMRVRINGLAFEVRSTLVSQPSEALADAILGAWRDAGVTGLRFEPAAGRTVLGRQTGPVHETVTLLDTAKPRQTAVVHATQDLRQSAASVPAPPFALPRDIRVVETIEHLERDSPITTFRLETALSKLDGFERLRVALIASRWSVTTRLVSLDRASMLEAARGSQRVMILALDGSNKTTFVVSLTGRAS